MRELVIRPKFRSKILDGRGKRRIFTTVGTTRAESVDEEVANTQQLVPRKSKVGAKWVRSTTKASSNDNAMQERLGMRQGAPWHLPGTHKQ